MIKLNLDNSKVDLASKDFSFSHSIDIPFDGYEPNISEIKNLASKYKDVKNIIVIGNGGSITSFNYYVSALGSLKNCYVIPTMEPDYLQSVKKKCEPSETVVISVSKSGNTVGVIEAFIYFINNGYDNVVVITQDKPSAIKQIQEQYGFTFLEHPVVGGRYSGFTPSGLLPAAIAGLDIEAIWNGAKNAYDRYGLLSPKNDAQKLASVFCSLDKNGYSEIFMPIYSSKLEGSINILMQIIHESSGKEGRGQTLVATFAPESQHHTNQRFFGGKKNMIGCFVTVNECQFEKDIIKIPSQISSIKLRDATLSVLGNNTYGHALHTEFMGTFRDSITNEIPCVNIAIDKITSLSVGEYLAFWHYVTVYICMILKVNPFDQPQVENSKEISFKMRIK